MRNLNSTGYNKTLLDWALLALRIFVGLGMLTHGFPKLMMLLTGKIEFINFFGIGQKTSLILAVFAEVLCSLFILMGLFTRFTVIPLIITMLVAVFIVHANQSFSKQEMALLYLFHYLIIFVAGPGSISIDRMITRK
ncbi:oxidoreductase [Cloacibacterium rupense]|uniref:Oxidoreductase n=1 Tax=Cloacibacterium rupense TaxID=517423 RepID=A0ABQ2NF21_9FLAO|nr:DoxX family protein [Cloacibacterium rupense]GGP01768.1 oxidoreductase [Cloacibacterium rupense]